MAQPGYELQFSVSDAALMKWGLKVGDRVRTPRGNADVAGVHDGLLWCKVDEARGCWFFTTAEVVQRKTEGYFLAGGVGIPETLAPAGSSAEESKHEGYLQESKSEEVVPVLGLPGRQRPAFSHSRSSIRPSTNQRIGSASGRRTSLSMLPTVEPFPPTDFLTFDALTRWNRWTIAMDQCIVHALGEYSDRQRLSPWNLTPKAVLDALSGPPRAELRRRSRFPGSPWDSDGPTDAAILCRVGIIHAFNDLVVKVLPFANVADALASTGRPPQQSALWGHTASKVEFLKRVRKKDPDCTATSLSLLLSKLRGSLYLISKQRMVEFAVQASITKVKKAEDDYDYPEDLSQIMLNRAKALNSQVFPIPEERLTSSLFGQINDALHFLDPSLLRLGYTHPMDDGQHRTFKVKFEGEGVDDYGGPYREIFTQLAQEVQALSKLGVKTECTLPLLQPTPNAFNSAGQEKSTLFICRPRLTRKLYLEMYNFLGQLLGIALRCKVTPRWDLPAPFWKALVGQPYEPEDLKSFDETAYTMISELKRLKQCAEVPQNKSLQSNVALGQLQDVLFGMNWVTRLSDGSEFELCEGGSQKSVSIDELDEYIDAIVHCRLHESATALVAIRDGLCSVVPSAVLPLLTWEELQLSICGRQEVNIDLLEANTEYDDDVSPKDPHIQCFWRVLRAYNEDDKAQFLRFVWARSRLPVNPEEFHQKFKIQAAVGEGARDNPDSFLPKAHTCFFSINLPKYSCDKIMAEKLKYAMYSCVEMDADFRLAENEMTGWDNLENI